MNIYCYTPLDDIIVMDKLISKVKATLRNRLEYAGGLTPEIIDEEKKAYLRKMKYRIPKEVM